MTPLERLVGFSEKFGGPITLKRLAKNEADIWSASCDGLDGEGVGINAACQTLLTQLADRQRKIVENRKKWLAEAEEAAKSVLEWL